MTAATFIDPIMFCSSRFCAFCLSFRKYQTISPIINHPGLLGELENNEWAGASMVSDPDKFKELWRSPKFIILAHLLAKATELGEKTLVYSKCLKTLDMIEGFLKSSDWRKQAGSLAKAFPDARSMGKWKKDKDYLRIDGSTDSGKRGHLVNTFNNVEEVRVFLISSIAGGIGINLVSSH